MPPISESLSLAVWASRFTGALALRWGILAVSIVVSVMNAVQIVSSRELRRNGPSILCGSDISLP
ncbi:MAG: hypothetical protein RXR41_00215 [Candidatus Marsarchaeota archaeon]